MRICSGREAGKNSCIRCCPMDTAVFKRHNDFSVGKLFVPFARIDDKKHNSAAFVLYILAIAAWA